MGLRNGDPFPPTRGPSCRQALGARAGRFSVSPGIFVKVQVAVVWSVTYAAIGRAASEGRRRSAPPIRRARARQWVIAHLRLCRLRASLRQEGRLWLGISRPTPSSRQSSTGPEISSPDEWSPSTLLSAPAVPSTRRRAASHRRPHEASRSVTTSLWAAHLGPELGGQGYGQLKLALMNEILGRSRLGPHRLRHPGPRHRQRRDHRPLRHRRTEGHVPPAAARGGDLLRATR